MEESSGGFGKIGQKIVETLGVDAKKMENNINQGKFDMVIEKRFWKIYFYRMITEVF